MLKKILLLALVLTLVPCVFSADRYQQNIGGTTASVPIRYLAAPTTLYYATNFTSNHTISITEIMYDLKKFGSPTGNVWIEIYNATVGGPTVNVSRIAKSNNVDVTTLSTAAAGAPVNFTFSSAFRIDASYTYTVVVGGDWALSSTNYVRSVNKVNTGTRLLYGMGQGSWTFDAANYQNNYQLWGNPVSNVTTSCTYTTGDWRIDIADNCNITATVTASASATLTLNGSPTSSAHRLNITGGSIKSFVTYKPIGLNTTIWGILG